MAKLEQGAAASLDQPIILLIENDDADVFLFRRALAKLCYDCRIYAVPTLTAARAYLENTGEYRHAAYYTRPRLIVSDFKLANGATALEFVRWLHSNPQFADIPLAILSGYASRLEPSQFDGLPVKAFLRKTLDVGELGALLRPILP